MHLIRAESYILILISIITIASCSNTELKNSLIAAKENRCEIEKVITYFEKENNKEKLRAAIFLIENMQDKFSLDNERRDDFKPVYSLIDSLFINKCNSNDIDNIVKQKIEYVISFNINNAIKSMDIQNISSDYLIDNINYAYNSWKLSSWSRHVNFDEFCEYILPYRVFTEPLSPWREFLAEKFLWVKDSVNDHTDPLEICKLINDYIANNYLYLPGMSKCPLQPVNEMWDIMAGTCLHRYTLIVCALRSMGVPVILQRTPQWNKWAGDHYWLAVLDKNGNLRPFNGGEKNITFPDSVYVPMGIGMASCVYSEMFAIQKNTLPFLIDSNDIPAFFQNQRLINSMDNYDFPMANLVFNNLKNNPAGSEYIYLGCFGYSQNIIPFTYTKIRNRNARFNSVSKWGIYIPYYYKENLVIYESNPIIVPKRHNKFTYLVPDFEKLQTIKLTRKYPVQEPMDTFSNEMIGAHFQGSNSITFDFPVNIYTIKDFPDHFMDVKVTVVHPYKYYRYISDNGRLRIAEIEFRFDEGSGNSNGNYSEIIGFTNGPGEGNYENAFDGNIRSNYNAPSGSWIGVALERPEKLSGIRYLVRNHMNIIETGDIYELFYFDFGWQSLGKKVATDNFLVYGQVPSNALLLLKDLTKGKEERIFTYENNEQVWW